MLSKLYVTHKPRITRMYTVMVDCVWNVMAHAQKPDFVFRRNGRVHLNRRGRQFSWLLAAEVWASAVVMLDTPCSEVVWRVLATQSIRQFPLHFSSRASLCAITFQLESTNNCIWVLKLVYIHNGLLTFLGLPCGHLQECKVSMFIDLMCKMKLLKCRNRSKGVITVTETSSLKIHKSESIFKQLWIISDTSVISFYNYNYNVSNFYILYSWRWLSGWSKHVAIQSVYKLILIQLCAFLGTIIIYIYILCVCVCECIYVYICTHTYIIHTYIHTHTQSGMLQRTRRTTIGRRSTPMRMTCRAFSLWLERHSSSLLSFARFRYQFSSVICLFVPSVVKIFFKLFCCIILATSQQNRVRKLDGNFAVGCGTGMDYP